ncbi:MAG: hypothetical protein OHK0024_33550 [Thalassobaculales bacterium]
MQTGSTDGVNLSSQGVTNADGSQSVAVAIPVVSSSRTETVGGNSVADLNLVQDADGEPAVLLQLPTGLGGDAIVENNRQSPTESLDSLVRAIQRVTRDAPGDQSAMTTAGSGFLTDIPATGQVVVTTFTPTVSTGVGQAVVLNVIGRSDPSSAYYEAFVIDARNLPTGSTLQMENVEFASIRGSVTVTGGTGSQSVVGDSDNQYFFLGEDDDTLRGGAGDDTLQSAGGNDRLYGETGNDTVIGGDDNDFVYGNQSDDVVYGNRGNDLAYGGQGADTLYGGQGEDRLYGGQGDDTLHGGLGSDTLEGGDGDDVLSGGEGGDLFLFLGGSGHDSILGFEDGSDRISIAGAQFADLAISASASGNAVITTSSGQTITLVGIRTDQVTADDFLAGDD